MKPIEPIKSRNADYELLNAFKGWKQVNDELSNGTHGNIQDTLYPSDPSYNKETKSWEYSKDKPYYEMVSSPMMLARLVSAGFTPLVEGQAGYKVTWIIVLQHEKTGCIATFHDCKGTSSFGACSKGHTNKTFQKALKKITDSLANERFPHPYDGCVVGEIA